jgi:hypothetical protein
MTVIRPNSISGITSIVAHSQTITFHTSDGSAISHLSANINTTSGVSTIANLNVPGIVTATTFSGNLTNTLTLNTSGTGISGSTTFNNSGVSTFTVTSNATPTNTGGAIVSRDAAGGFNVGVVTASSGNFSGIVTSSGVNISGLSTFSGIATYTAPIFGTQASFSGVVTATSFSGDGTNLSNTGSTLSAASDTQRVVLTTLTTGTMTSSSTDADLTFNASSNTLSIPNISASGVITATSFSGDGTNLSNTGSTVVNDTTTNSTFYPLFTSITSGTVTGSRVSTTKLSFNPSTGTLSATTLSGTVSGGNVSGNISGNAANITAYTVNQSVGTSNNVQFNSIGAGTAASGTAGEIRATNNVTAYYSDDRLKTRLGKIENAIDKVCSLNGFYYEANQTAQDLGYKVKREVGVSAQEVQSILPEIIAPAPIDEKYMTVYYERLVPLLIEAIKEQQATINNLIERTNNLEEKCH